MMTSVKTSKFLKVGEVYTRNELRNGFHIRDAALNNGIFKPKGHTSVWLFITQEKSRDRRPYRDSLVGDTLRMEGQTRGRHQVSRPHRPDENKPHRAGSRRNGPGTP